MKRQRFRLTVVLALLTATMTIGGVALARNAEPTPGGAASAAAADPFMGVADPSAPYGLRFLDAMLMHHQGAIVSARMMIGNSSRPELRDLARRISDGQQRQVDQMRAWRQQWYPDAGVPTTGMGSRSGGGGMMGGTGGTMGGGMIGGNNGGMMGGSNGGMMGGDTAERMFLRMMIPHHQLAIDMAQGALKNAQHDELRGLARAIVADQSAEITEMEGDLQAWYGEDSTRDTAAPLRDMMYRMPGGRGR